MQPLQQFVIKDGQIMEAPPGASSAATGMSSTPIYLGVAMVFCMMATGFGGYWYGKFNVLDQMMQNGGRVAMSPSGGNAGGGFNLQSAASEPTKATKSSRPEGKRSERTQQTSVRTSPATPAQSRPAESANAVSASQESVKNQLKDGLERDASGKVYEVRSGDTLGQIANRVYGDPSQFPRLFEANPRVLASPDNIVPGQVLRVPD
ncbi:LysM peptidoglycan-binding domain-containing protein [Limnohabitans sp.]|uniref:LysM peptidoglycan-binding domain-containing protein n=1 Tax=Limnohabitans sp. TaxID=1907725 RepID=UPI00286EDD5F|nr:LysM peptidoglycan-binding domain-containing protein [Limnohabitans sp.]